ncbi:hypothetical protein [Rhodococcoides trifolii]|uniref:hypothetical protein n=1 Tax=Rhodococcoides trifolii TaxID=908250 RepID=UPI001662BF14|nr:hypothetical protein [Rhodococcus trifolii]
MSDTSAERGGDQSIEAVRRAWLTENWASVVVGLVLVALVLAGVIPASLVP